jgi:hypothetical protein
MLCGRIWRGKSGQTLLFRYKSILARIISELLRVDSSGVRASQRLSEPATSENRQNSKESTFQILQLNQLLIEYL